METRRKMIRCEWVLLDLTLLFLCLISGLFLRDRAIMAVPAFVEIGLTAPMKVPSPDLPRLNLNTASAEELAALPGIDGVLAQHILEYLEANGPLGTVEELTNVSGIDFGNLIALEGLVTVEETE